MDEEGISIINVSSYSFSTIRFIVPFSIIISYNIYKLLNNYTKKDYQKTKFKFI